jgi:NADH-quinone oxidoreductase subunit L
MKELLWLVPILPFVGVLLNGILLRNRISKKAVSWIACGSVGIAAFIGIFLVIPSYMGSEEYAQHVPFEQDLYLWIPAGALQMSDGGWTDLSIELGFLLDPLSAVMLFVVTFVGFWIHIYSIGYMAEDPGYQRYFTYMNLFMGAMLLLILGNNFLVMFVGWEGVGLCSYLLIGFWFEEKFPPYAGRKAFIVNRIGDAGFLIGLFALATTFGTLNFREIFGRIAADPHVVQEPYLLGLSLAGFVGLCLFIGAVGKSAQIPLLVWLPDAMAGPTPVSALIHAATMVTAGVYMVARSNVIYQLTSGVSTLVAVVGCVTAIFAATIGLAQTDIKKVLAYSTVSQLGYMFLAAGVGAYGVAIFHLMTHAFFKGLMFLGSGSVIHAMGGEQDMRKMGGLKKYMPATYWTFLVGTLAISGVPFFAGFFSKDQILASVFGGHKTRGSEEQREHLHESPPVMTVPLVVLAVGAAVSGWVGWPQLGGWDWNWIGRFLAPALSVAVAGVGIWLAWRTYGADRGLAGGESWAERYPAVHRLLVNKYWVDEIYDEMVVRPRRAIARFCWKVVDAILIEGVVHTGPFVTRLFGDIGRFTTTGNVRDYALYFFIGVILLFWWLAY